MKQVVIFILVSIAFYSTSYGQDKSIYNSDVYDLVMAK